MVQIEVYKYDADMEKCQHIYQLILMTQPVNMESTRW